jgi:hypothetical protein
VQQAPLVAWAAARRASAVPPGRAALPAAVAQEERAPEALLEVRAVPAAELLAVAAQVALPAARVPMAAQGPAAARVRMAA